MDTDKTPEELERLRLARLAYEQEMELSRQNPAHAEEVEYLWFYLRPRTEGVRCDSMRMEELEAELIALIPHCLFTRDVTGQVTKLKEGPEADSFEMCASATDYRTVNDEEHAIRDLLYDRGFNVWRLYRPEDKQ